MNFFIEQIALYPRDAEKAQAFLEELGAQFIHDDVTACGSVGDEVPVWNFAHLRFDYKMAPKSVELEILEYEGGMNWMDRHPPSVSHLGMHCTEEELDRWKEFFSERNIPIAQEVRTEAHTNPYLIQTGRKYHYCIFDTREILGTDLKFIVRINREGEAK